MFSIKIVDDAGEGKYQAVVMPEGGGPDVPPIPYRALAGLGLILAFLTGCGQPGATQAGAPSTPQGPRARAIEQTPDELGEVSGQVFIVTASRVNIKMGLVSVGAVRDDVASEFVRQLNERNATYRKEADRTRQRLDAARRDLAAAEQRLRDAKEQDQKDWHAFLRHPADSPGHVSYDSVAHNRAIAVAKEDVAQRENAISTIAHPSRMYETAEVQCASLPPAFAAAKTDADGLFSLTVPRKRPFVLAARATRDVVGQREFYCWFLEVSLDGATTKRVLLSNDNTTDSGAPGSLLHTRSE